MKLKSLHVYKNYDDAHYRARIEFEGSYGTVELNLDKQLSEKMLAVCADEIVASSKEVAENMTANFVEGQLAPAIEHHDGAEQSP
ncbi:MAG: hypothetical protein V3S55_06210 [Nitrospiraceae bacterium]